MKQVTLNIPENRFNFFMELMRSLPFVELDKISENSLSADQLKTWNNIKQGFEELELINSGKAKSRPLQELLDEL